MVVIDEGHHAYTETALATIDGFNPCFMLELSATPRVSSAQGSGSNILVNVRGTDLDDAEMIKLPIHVDMRGWSDWQSCLTSSLQQLDTLQQEAWALQSETNRYIRPILLVQVERTGKDMRDAGYIHAEDAKAHLMQLGLTERQIAALGMGSFLSVAQGSKEPPRFMVLKYTGAAKTEAPAAGETADTKPEDKPAQEEAAKVVSLDQFRKK